MKVPMEQPLGDQMEDEPMDEETEEGPMYEEPIDIEESKEEPMGELNRGVRMELVTLMMVMILTILIPMMRVIMVVMEMVVMVEMVMEMMVVMVTEMEETMEMGVMMIMMHCWLKGGPRRSTMI